MDVASKPAVEVEDTLHQKTVLYCKQLVGAVLKMSVNQIDSSEPLESLGIDSIIVGQINARLQEHFDEISSTLLFEFQTIDALAEHFVKTQKANLLNLFELDPGAEPAALVPVEPVARVPVKLNPRLSGRRSRRLRVINSPASAGEPAAIDRRIAIIGISGMYPRAANLDEYWENLKSGTNCTGEIPPVRWRLDDFYEPDAKRAAELGKSYSKWGGFLDRFSEFDASFFGVSPLEAMSIDPQERLFLQSAWQALENAGYTRAALKNKFKQKVGVFAGITKLGYNLYGSSRTIRENKFFPRTSFSSVANRLSYFLDLNGPSMPVDTMCSSSLTAIHEACEHIYRGECELAFAGGVNLYLHPSSYIDLSVQGMLSRDAFCKSFGEGADGFVPGEGVGVVLLKPLAKAVRDKDTIHGVILATHVNHGGRSNGYTVPNPRAQTDVIRQAMDKAGINAREISYIEAHGTGTELGDSIEISVLQQAFAKDTQDLHFCRLGSVKSNIGHCESAAGISGLTKILLQFRHRQIAPSLHSERLNPHINLEKSPFVLNRDLTTWTAPVIDGREKSRIAGISSFGAGGANAHVIVQEYLPPAEIRQSDTVSPRKASVAILLSARTPEQLRQKAVDLLNFICPADTDDLNPGASETLDLAAVAYTLQVGREAMDERLGFMVASPDQLVRRLRAYLDGDEGMEDTYRGNAKQDKDTLHLFNSDSDLKETVDRWTSQKKLPNLLKLWVKGLDLDWEKLYDEDRPQRISLPTYPFANQRYWIDSLGITSAEDGRYSHERGLSSVASGGRISHMPDVSEKWRFSGQCAPGDKGADGVQNEIPMNALDKIKLFLKQELASQLQLPLRDIAEDRNLIELGIDSMGITKLIRNINQLLEENVLPSVLFEYPDIRKLSEHLLAAYPEKIEALIVERLERRTDTGKSSNIVVPMQPEGNKPPIFAVPGGPGNVLAFMPLCLALGNKQPFYGLQPVGLDGGAPPSGSMEAAARSNIDAMKAIQAEGPYTLIGYSNGGVVAYEMARILLEQNEKLASLTLLDSVCPTLRVNDLVEETVEVGNNFMKTLGVNLGLDAERLRQVPEGERCEYLYEAMTAKGLDITKEQFFSSYAVAEASDRACRTYKPTKLPGRIEVSLFRATEAYEDLPDDYGWNQLLLNPIRIFRINADHFTIMNEDSAGEIVKNIFASARGNFGRKAKGRSSR